MFADHLENPLVLVGEVDLQSIPILTVIDVEICESAIQIKLLLGSQRSLEMKRCVYTVSTSN